MECLLSKTQSWAPATFLPKAAAALICTQVAVAEATLLFCQKQKNIQQKERWHLNAVPNGEISTLFTKFTIQAFKVLVLGTNGISKLKR